MNATPLIDSWADGLGMTEHTRLEVNHATRVARNEAVLLATTDPVPGCSCPLCVLMALPIKQSTVDTALHEVLPPLATREPSDRPALAQRFRCEIPDLPSTAVLVALAAKIPGARKAPRAVPTCQDELPIEAARARPILGVVESLGIKLRQTGKSWRGRCPFHESESGMSFSVDPDKDLWHCFSCGAGGDTIALVERVRGVGFVEAVRELAL